MKFKLHIENTLEKLLAQEDTDGDKKITTDDVGPKKFVLQDENGNEAVIQGTYHLSNLLQELALSKKNNTAFATIELKNIIEDPVDRISRKIRDLYWDGLTRTIDADGIFKIAEDEKTTNPVYNVYVSAKDNTAFDYFKKLEKENPAIEVIQLPEEITPEYTLFLDKKPGILALALQEKNGKLAGVPFVVPGGRFNEMYGWDSYFIAMGLLVDGKFELAKAIAENFKYQIDNYGKILNANRSYYLTRTQPPLYSSLIRDILKYEKQEKSWVAKHLKAIITEYDTVWMEPGNRLTVNGLNRYKAEGVGLPFEVEAGHFDDILEEYAARYNMPLREFEKKYLKREITDATLDLYFHHDRSMRESGHDTTNQLINVCADLNVISLNSLLYKYETDIASLIKNIFDDKFLFDRNTTYDSEYWNRKAESRKEKVDQFCWDKNKAMYFDYNFIKQAPHEFEAATTFYPLWAKLCSAEQALDLVKKTLPKFKMKGGISGSTKEAISTVGSNEPQRQWDYPFGWAPQQILLWQGLLNYNFNDEAQEMVYRWLWLITKNAIDFNGTIPEKYNLETSSHKVFAEYGNVGTEFDFITEEGFGWMNASYQFGLTILCPNLKKQLALLTDPNLIFGI